MGAVKKKTPCVFSLFADGGKANTRANSSLMHRGFPVSSEGYRKVTMLMDALRRKGRASDLSMYCPDSDAAEIILLRCDQDGQCAPWGFDHTRDQKRRVRANSQSSKTARIPLAGVSKKKKRK